MSVYYNLEGRVYCHLCGQDITDRQQRKIIEGTKTACAPLCVPEPPSTQTTVPWVMYGFRDARRCWAGDGYE